ncbi:MAG: tyrosine-type recombinase/integrase [Acidimicrobiales bacterium]
MAGTKTEIRPGVWRLRAYVGRRSNGTPIQITKTLVTPEAKRGTARPGDGVRLADRELARMVAGVSAGQFGSSATTVSALIDRWLEHLDSLGRSPTTMRKYRDIANRVVVPAIGNVRLSKLTAAHLDALYAALTAKGNKPATVRRVHALIGAALRQAERWDLVEKNVSKKATPPPVRQAPVTAPSPEEVLTIIAQAQEADPRLARMLLIAALTGARRGELCAIRWSDLDWDTHTLTVACSIYEVVGGGWAEKPTKNHQERRVSLDDLALDTFRQQRESVEDLARQLDLTVLEDGFVWSPSPVGAEPYRPTSISHFLSRTAQQAGVKTHLHALRHFSATQGIAAGTDVVTMAGRLGHRDPSVTLRVYAHALEQRDRGVATAIGASLARGLRLTKPISKQLSSS